MALDNKDFYQAVQKYGEAAKTSANGQVSTYLTTNSSLPEAIALSSKIADTNAVLNVTPVITCSSLSATSCGGGYTYDSSKASITATAGTYIATCCKVDPYDNTNPLAESTSSQKVYLALNNNTSDTMSTLGTGTITGGVTGTTGPDGVSNSAYHFNGTGYISYTNLLPVGLSSFSVTGWFKPASTSAGQRMLIFDKSVSFFAGFNNTSSFELAPADLSSDAINRSSGVGMTTTDWFFFAYTCDGTAAGTKLYLKNKSSGQTESKKLSQVGTAIGGTTFMIGAEPPGGTLNWNGEISKIRVFGKSLSQTEIDTLFNGIH